MPRPSAIRDVGDAISRGRAELLVAAALLAGWTLITVGIVAVTSPVAWAFSLGVLLLLLCGWRLLWRVFSDGLYDLTREVKRGE